MKKFEIKKEVWIWLIIALPSIYLAYTWNSLPAIVPTHFGIDGTPNGWSSKNSLIYIIAGLPIGIYALMCVIPYIDPKGKISSMGSKYFTLKLFLVLFICAISMFIVQSAKDKTLGHPYLLFLIIGGLFAFLGNFMQTVKPNYFIGIRTPWTLENEVVWRKTHSVGGKLFFVAGILIMILPFLLHQAFEEIMVGIIIAVSVVPVVYSYIVFRQEKNKVA